MRWKHLWRPSRCSCRAVPALRPGPAALARARGQPHPPATWMRSVLGRCSAFSMNTSSTPCRSTIAGCRLQEGMCTAAGAALPVQGPQAWRAQRAHRSPPFAGAATAGTRSGVWYKKCCAS